MSEPTGVVLHDADADELVETSVFRVLHEGRWRVLRLRVGRGVIRDEDPPLTLAGLAAGTAVMRPMPPIVWDLSSDLVDAVLAMADEDERAPAGEEPDGGEATETGGSENVATDNLGEGLR